jgi:hypothetical protein
VFPCNRFCSNKDTFYPSLFEILSSKIHISWCILKIMFIILSNQAVPGIPKIKEGCNPATWMLDVTSASTEVQLNIDFAEHYKSSTMHQ